MTHSRFAYWCEPCQEWRPMKTARLLEHGEDPDGPSNACPKCGFRMLPREHRPPAARASSPSER